RKRTIDDERANLLGQSQKPQGIGHMAAALADHIAQVGLRVVVLLHELLVAARLLDRVEIRTLHVLDDSEFERRAVIDLADDDRYFSKAGPLGCTPAPLAGDDLVAVA